MAELARVEQSPLSAVVSHPIFHMGGLIVGLAASIALGIWVFMWSQTPDYSVLYKQLGLQDATEIANVLDNAQIQYRLDVDSGVVLVDSSRLNEARLKIASANLTPGGGGTGFELLEKEQGFGTSALIQSARYHRAQEGELARTIASISSIQSARVHLALPKQSAFLRNNRKPSASVMLQLLPGRRLEKQQIAAITNLVAASVANMETSQVTVVDSNGRLLSSGEDGRELALSASQFDYTRNLEQSYIERIERILAPIVGVNGVRAQVVADIDFTRTEYTKESYNPDLPALRSEQTFEEQLRGNVNEGAVPGAVSNEPPADATALEQGTTQTAETETAVTPGKSRKRSTRNYELDKTISHTQGATGKLRRLSIAVVLNYKRVTGKGKASSAPYTTEEIARLTSLIKETIGFNSLRGDTVNIMNSAFILPEPVKALPEVPIWKQSWVIPVVKQVLGGLVVLFFLIKLLKVIQNLATRPLQIQRVSQGDDGELTEEGGQRLPKPKMHSYEENLVAAKQLATQEPKRVAQVVRNWANVE